MATEYRASILDAYMRMVSRNAGHTVEIPISDAAYLGPDVDRLMYHTPEFAAVNALVARDSSGTILLMAAPEEEDRARRLVAALEAAVQK